ncbi:MAG TPA: TRAP transporter TatT component family protein [Sandaracinaceae bacterium LLY-WYZ-13_1]|nr:TRAP transporter TatT component family protein [Sandaracinaceae bacterium LLY-WYZ-13_1]
MTIAFASWVGLAFFPGCGGSYESAWDEPTEETGSEQTQTEEGQSQRAELIARGDAAWEQRDDPDRIRAAIEAWEQATELDGSDAETWVKISRAYYFLADGHLRFSDEEAMGDTYQSGIRAAERALRALSPEFAEAMAAGQRVEEAVGVLDADAVPALYWRATNLGKWARRDGFATVLSYKDEIRAVMSRCLELDRYYYFAGPDRYFGAFFSIAPTYAGGDIDRSRQHFEESIRRFPDYFGTRVLFAEEYAVKAQDRELYEEQLRYVIEGDPESLEGAAPENRVEQRKAQAAMERIDELFE